MENNTIFDDVFRTMLEKMPQLVIPVINEVFHTSYSKEEKINQYRNEHHTASGEIITILILESVINCIILNVKAVLRAIW